MFPNDTVWSFSDPGINLSFINSTTGWVLKTFVSVFSNSFGAVVYKTTNGGNNWERNVISQNAGDMGFAIQFIDANNGWATVINLNTMIPSLYKTTNGGNNGVDFYGIICEVLFCGCEQRLGNYTSSR